MIFCLLARPRKTPFAPIALISYDAAAISQCSCRFIVFTTCVSTASVALLTFFYSRHLCFIFTSDILEREHGASPAAYLPRSPLSHHRERLLIGNAFKCVRVLRKSGRAFWRLHLSLNKTEPRSNPVRASYFIWGERGGMSLKALAERLAMDDSAVSQGAKRLKRLRSESPKLDRILRRMKSKTKEPLGSLQRLFIITGSPGRIRTSDPTVNSRLLCQLSYWGIKEK